MPGIALDLDSVGRGSKHALHQEPRAVSRIPYDDELTRPGRARGHEKEPVPVAERGLHARARDRDAKRYFLVAQKMSLISLTAAWRSAAAFASTLCLFLLQSFAAFQNVSWRFGYFSRCSGLK